MSTTVILLFALRLLSAGLLLAFVGIIGYYVWRDVRLAAFSAEPAHRPSGSVRQIAPDEVLFDLYAVTSLGRSAANTVTLPSSFVSAEHALITRRGAQWWLEDLDSRNGTLLNEVPIDGPVVVAAGDVIGIGDYRFVLEPEG